MADQRSTHDLQRDKAMKSEGTGITKSPRTHRFLQNYSTALSTESSCNVGIWCNSYLITLNAACRYNLYKGRDPGLSTALYIFDSARQRGLGEYRPRGDWNFWTNDRCRQHPRASFSPEASSHSELSVPTVTGKHGVQEPRDAQLLRRFGRVGASTATTPGKAREPRRSRGLGGFIPLLWLHETWEGGK